MPALELVNGKREVGSGNWKLAEWTRVLIAANSVNVACLRSHAAHAAGPAKTKTIVNRRGNVTNEFYAQFHFMRQHQRNKAQSERASEPLPGRAIQSDSLCTHSVCGCVCACVSAESCHIYCLAVPPAVTLLQPLPCSLTASLSLSYADQRSVGKNPIRRRMCRVWRFENHRSLFFPSALCVCVCFLFVSFCLSRGEQEEG